MMVRMSYCSLVRCRHYYFHRIVHCTTTHGIAGYGILYCPNYHQHNHTIYTSHQSHRTSPFNPPPSDDTCTCTDDADTDTFDGTGQQSRGGPRPGGGGGGGGGRGGAAVRGAAEHGRGGAAQEASRDAQTHGRTGAHVAASRCLGSALDVLFAHVCVLCYAVWICLRFMFFCMLHNVVLCLMPHVCMSVSLFFYRFNYLGILFVY